jgi:hypothetical protein
MRDVLAGRRSKKKWHDPEEGKAGRFFTRFKIVAPFSHLPGEAREGFVPWMSLHLAWAAIEKHGTILKRGKAGRFTDAL